MKVCDLLKVSNTNGENPVNEFEAAVFALTHRCLFLFELLENDSVFNSSLSHCSVMNSHRVPELQRSR